MVLRATCRCWISIRFPTYFDDPYDAMEEMRDAGPVIWLSRYSIAAVARHEEVREALSNWRMLSSARGVGMEDFDRHGRFRLPSLILEADPPEHSRARGVLSAVLSPPVLKQIRADIERKAEMLVDQLLERRRFDAVADLACAFPLAVFPNAIGLPLAGREKLLPHAEALFNSFGPRNELFKRSAAQADFAAIQEQGRKENLLPGGLGDEGACRRRARRLPIRSIGDAGARPVAGRPRHHDQRDRRRHLLPGALSRPVAKAASEPRSGA